MDAEQPTPSRPAEIGIAAFETGIAQIDAVLAQLAAEIAEENARLAQLAPPPRPASQVATPGDRQQQQREMAQAQDAIRVGIDARRQQNGSLAAQRARLACGLDALRRLAAWDALTAATRQANTLIAELDRGSDGSADALSAVRKRLDAALQRRAAAFLVWRIDFAGDGVPELLPLPE